MERFVEGDVIVLPFPFTDLSSAKRRPAVIFSDLKGVEMINRVILFHYKNPSVYGT